MFSSHVIIRGVSVRKVKCYHLATAVYMVMCQVFVEGLPDVFAPFGSLCLVKAELLCTPADR